MPTLRYAITDRSYYGESEADREAALLKQAERLAKMGIDFILLREQDLDAGDLARLARSLLTVLRAINPATRLLIHSRADIAAATGADGIHLPSGTGQLTPDQTRRVFAASWSVRAGHDLARRPIVSVSCHNRADIQRACDHGADLVLFGPVFGKFMHGKLLSPATGLEGLRMACSTAGITPVLALGGVAEADVASCLEAGAGGVAAIRMFL